MKTWTIPTDGLWFTDNGAVLCAKHLGSSAKYSGRDISGQPIERVTSADHAEAATMGFPLKCECCPVHAIA